MPTIDDIAEEDRVIYKNDYKSNYSLDSYIENEIKEIIENEKGPPNEEENNKEQFRKSYTFLDNYIKEKKLSFTCAYIYTYLLNGYTIKKEYSRKYRKRFEIYQKFEYQELITKFNINFRTLKKVLEELEKVGLIELKKEDNFKIYFLIKKPTN